MWYVKLCDVQFRANHGVYEQETILGNEFIVNVSVGFIQTEIYHMHQTIDYVLLYNIVEKEMQTPRKLLEEVITRIVIEMELQIKGMKELKIAIKKMNPPFGQNVNATVVEILKEY